MTERDPNGRAAPPPRPGVHSDIEAVPLRIRSQPEPVSGQFLTRVRFEPTESRRDALARLSAWARAADVTAAVLNDRAGQLYADTRALGFDDAGPLPRFAARVRPGLIRRTLAAVLLPGPRVPASLEVVPEPLPEGDEAALRERLAPEFGALSGLPADLPAPGVHLLGDGKPIASCRLELPAEAASGTVAVPHWIAPPGDPDVVALLARETLRAAAGAGAAAVVFETTHRGLATGLLLARFLPRRSRARVLVRQGGDPDASTPSTADWHLTTATRAAGGGRAREAL